MFLLNVGLNQLRMEFKKKIILIAINGGVQ